MQSDSNENASTDPILGKTVGNYEVTQKIGEGGMGSVYLAQHPLIGKKVALKVLHSEFASNQDVVTRFFNEAKAVNDIQHPNIVDIVDYGVFPSERGEMVYFIMEHLDGHPLENVIEEQAPLPPERGLAICVQVADALTASHQSQIVHRDLKPDNIILVKHRTTDDFVKLLDFGIAKLTGDQPGSSRTRTGIVMGTPAYMSPEQCEGKGNIDARTDIYALGVVAFQMLTGRVPFVGEGYGEILVQHLTQPPPAMSSIVQGIPPHVEAVVMKALEKRPDARYQTMDDFMAALRDPVNFVEANGGLQGFHQAHLATPIRPEPSPASPSGYYTPAPGSLTPAGATPASGIHGSPSGLHGGHAMGAPAKSKTPIIIAGIAALAAIVIAVVVVGGGGEDKTAEPVATAEAHAAQAAPEEAVVTPPVEETQPEPPEVKSEPALEPVKVSASVMSTPKGAEIYSGEEFLGKTPERIEFTDGDLPLTLTLKQKGYEDAEIEWSFDPDKSRQHYRLSASMEKESRRVSSRSKKRTSSTKSTSSSTKAKKTEKKQVGDNTVAPSFLDGL